ncbi:MAG TPA: nucleotidyltransferase domain-containing protein [bacterium]|nr:nucleotidyltransferase domain-containing protein [bacterium]
MSQARRGADTLSGCRGPRGALKDRSGGLAYLTGACVRRNDCQGGPRVPGRGLARVRAPRSWTGLRKVARVTTGGPRRLAYPTAAHEKAAEAVVGMFRHLAPVPAVILRGSCARGRATRDSCVDIVVLTSDAASPDDRRTLEQSWERAYRVEAVYETLRSVGRFSHVDLDVTDGRFAEPPRGWTSGPDSFELEIGNTVAYTVPLWQRGEAFNRLAGQWLPYYDDARRARRLAATIGFARNNLAHVPLYVERGLYFQAFHRLYHAFQEFLQALFIAHRTYPIAYDKWIREQIEEILGLPDLYRQLPGLFEYRRFESDELTARAEHLERLLGEYAVTRG